MGLTNAELRTILKKHLHSDSTISDPTDLNYYLSLGQERIVHDAPSSLGAKAGSLTLSATGTREYSLASDFYQLARQPWIATESMDLEVLTPGVLVDEVERLNDVPGGVPTGCCIVGYSASETRWRIKFDREPDAAYVVGYFYYWLPAKINDSGSTATSPIADAGFSNLLLWAATMLAREHNDPDGAEQAFKMYGAELVNYRAYSPYRPAHAGVVGGWERRAPSRLGSHYSIGS